MINSVVLMGRRVADPEPKHTASGVSVCSFRIAVDRNYTGDGEERKADFINIVAWRNTADFVGRYFRKGQLIAVQGSLQSDSYTDKDGNKRTAYTVVAGNVSFAGDKQERPAEYAAPSQTPAPSFAPVSVGVQLDISGDDELPF